MNCPERCERWASVMPALLKIEQRLYSKHLTAICQRAMRTTAQKIGTVCRHLASLFVPRSQTDGAWTEIGASARCANVCALGVRIQLAHQRVANSVIRRVCRGGLAYGSECQTLVCCMGTGLSKIRSWATWLAPFAIAPARPPNL